MKESQIKIESQKKQDIDYGEGEVEDKIQDIGEETIQKEEKPVEKDEFDVSEYEHFAAINQVEQFELQKHMQNVYHQIYSTYIQIFNRSNPLYQCLDQASPRHSSSDRVDSE